jgi:hypothetical protein
VLLDTDDADDATARTDSGNINQSIFRSKYFCWKEYILDEERIEVESMLDASMRQLLWW